MKPFYFLITLLLSFQLTGQTMAQVSLPVDASNCAIFNALNPDDSLYCTGTENLGTPRGLIVSLDGLTATPDTSQVIAKLPDKTGKAIIVKRAKSAKIDYKAAKSESGYYIHFAFDSETLEKEYRNHLDRLVIVLNAPSMKGNCVKITGHTDTVGSAAYNLDLSHRRAKSVYDYLATLEQIDKERFAIEAKGESLPLPDKAGTSPYNRRVEFSPKTVATDCKPNS